jgi:hypothetical protein
VRIDSRGADIAQVETTSEKGRDVRRIRVTFCRKNGRKVLKINIFHNIDSIRG